MLALVTALFSIIFGWKGFNAWMHRRHIASMQTPAVTVSAMKAEYSSWQPTLKAVGSLRAFVGVNVTTELAGMVEKIYFTPGSKTQKGELLVQLNADSEIGELHSLEAQVELAKITYQRNKAQFKAHAVSKQTVDTDEWTLKNLQAQVEKQKAIVEKKSIRAPFSGFLGINNVNPGQYLNVGDAVATLQTLNPIYVDFYLPQQTLSELKTQQTVNVVVDAFPDKVFEGRITTIQPAVDSDTRNVLVEATIANPKKLLKPGMFVSVTVNVKEAQSYITLPQSAISFNPYGDLVSVITDSGKKDKNNKPILIVQQIFVSLGPTRGDQIAILKGLKKGDIIVTSGQLKLKNGSIVKINNHVPPSNNPDPKVVEQ